VLPGAAAPIPPTSATTAANAFAAAARPMDRSAQTRVLPMHATILIGLYLLVVAIAQVAGYFVGIFIERSAPAIGLPAYLMVSLGMLILAWPIAVWLTDHLLGPEPPRG
jgi:hypothetical protein